MKQNFVYDVKYRDKHGNVRVFSCLDEDINGARSQAYKMVCDLNDYSGTILTVLQVNDDTEWSNGFIV